ncbi:MAG: alpha/beta hydrolase [Maribacter sp.]|nr:alpha/beta hydrolase [Maribacter sp.]
MRKLFLIILTLTLINTTAVSQNKRFVDQLELKKVEGSEEIYYEGYFATLENHDNPKSNTIQIHVIVIPARADAQKDAVTYLAGGGVLPATRFKNIFMNNAELLRKNRDILLVDQRGTYGSNPLECGISSDVNGEAYIEAMRDCVERLNEEADLSYYTTDMAMRDLDAIRNWLGYESLNVWGTSYGTKAARTYAKMFPDKTRTITLHGVVPINFSMWPYDSFLAQLALDNLLVDCELDSGCSKTYPNIESQYKFVYEKLKKEPQIINLLLEDSISYSASFGHNELSSILYSLLYTNEGSKTIPWLIDQLWNENYDVVIKNLTPSSSHRIPVGVSFCIACNEEMPRMNYAAFEKRAMGDFGNAWFKQQFEVCKLFPTRKLPDTFWDPLTTDIPVLILSGSKDHVTPPAFGRQVSHTLENVNHIIMPGKGHDDIDFCMLEVIQHFIASGQHKKLNTDCFYKSESLLFKGVD